MPYTSQKSFYATSLFSSYSNIQHIKKIHNIYICLQCSSTINHTAFQLIHHAIKHKTSYQQCWQSPELLTRRGQRGVICTSFHSSLGITYTHYKSFDSHYTPLLSQISVHKTMLLLTAYTA